MPIIWREDLCGRVWEGKERGSFFSWLAGRANGNGLHTGWKPLRTIHWLWNLMIPVHLQTHTEPSLTLPWARTPRACGVKRTPEYVSINDCFLSFLPLICHEKKASALFLLPFHTEYCSKTLTPYGVGRVVKVTRVYFNILLWGL